MRKLASDASWARFNTKTKQRQAEKAGGLKISAALVLGLSAGFKKSQGEISASVNEKDAGSMAAKPGQQAEKPA
jgi:hypothetical protein